MSIDISELEGWTLPLCCHSSLVNTWESLKGFYGVGNNRGNHKWAFLELIINLQVSVASWAILGVGGTLKLWGQQHICAGR